MRHPSGLLLATAGMLALAVAMGIGRFAFTPILPMMQDAGLSLAAAGWLASANYFGYFAGAVSAMWMRFSATTLIRVALVVISISTVGMGFVQDPFAWLVLRGLAGVASAWVLIFASAWTLPRLAAVGQQRLSGLLFGGVGLGTALAGVCCLLFLRFSWSADQAWIMLGAVSLLCTATIWPIYRDSVGVDGRKPASRPLPASPPQQPTRSMLLVVCYGLFGFGYIIPATFLPAMAKQMIPDPALFGWAWPIFGAAALVSTLVAGWLTSRLPERTIWVAGHVVMAVGVVIPVLLPNMTGIVISALCVGGTFMVVTLAGMQQARRVAPDNPERLMASMTSAFAIGQILGPMLIGVVGSEEQGFTVLLVVASAVLGISAVALLVGGVEEHRRTRADHA